MDKVNSFGTGELKGSQLNTFLHSFFNSSGVNIVFIDISGKITEINPAFINFSGYNPEELSGNKFIDLIHPPYQKNVAEIIENFDLFSREQVECEFIIKSDRATSIVLDINVIKDSEGNPSGAAMFIVNSHAPNSAQGGEALQPNQYQSELEDTISKFTTLIDNSRDVLYSLYYQSFMFEYLCPSVIELTGYSNDELMMMTPKQMLQIIHPDFRRTYLKYWNSLKYKVDKSNHTIEYKIRPKLGISRWLSDNHKLILNEHGDIVKLVGNIRDITDFKLVEEALNRSRDRLFKAIEATNDGMWDWRLNTNKVYFDARFYTMLGYEPLEFPAAVDEWMKRIHPNDIRHVQEQLNKHLDGKSSQWLIEYRFLAKNGEWVWLLNRGKIFERGANGQPMRMVGTHSDISLRKKAEEELHKRNDELQVIYDQLQISEEKFRQLAENTQDVFWLRDEDRIIYINPAFDKVWGRDREMVILKPSLIKEWVHPDDQEHFLGWVTSSTFKEQKMMVEQYKIIKPGGEIRWIWSRMFPVYDEKKQIYRIAGIASDITDQKMVEEALIAAKEKALESDQLKSAFLANISHEIRTPMNGIIGFAELLKDDNLSVENRIQFVNIITKSSEQLLHIIDDIIDISKIEANQVNINKTNIAAESFLSDLQIFYNNEKIQMGKGHIEIQTTIPHSPVPVMLNTDESRLRQILMNLISNALKFTEKGHVTFGYKVLPDLNIEFYVEDSGIGIPANRQSQIFKRFRQLDDAFTRKFGGTGLGLAICEGLVKLLGGQIRVHSEEEKGSTFYFTIPTGDNRPKDIKAKKDMNQSGDFNWMGKTILVVEDDEINQEFLNAILSPTNATVICASTGEDAVMLFRENEQIDLVLMDIRLPRMNGYEAFEKIRQIRSSIPVIAQTAFAMTEDAAKCMEMGFSEYISKPINRKNLLAMINKLLG